MALSLGNSALSNDLWQAALGPLEQIVPKPVFEMWVKPIRICSLQGNVLTVSVQTNFARDWVENRLKAQIVQVLSGILGEEIVLELTVADEAAEPTVDGAPATPTSAAQAAPRSSDDLRSANLNARYTFEEFVIGSSNRFAH